MRRRPEKKLDAGHAGLMNAYLVLLFRPRYPVFRSSFRGRHLGAIPISTTTRRGKESAIPAENRKHNRRKGRSVRRKSYVLFLVWLLLLSEEAADDSGTPKWGVALRKVKT